jgi:VWFA-related protein
MKHQVRLAALLAVSVIALGVPRGALAQDVDVRPSFSSGVALVPISAVVKDTRGRLVRDLAREDFEVLENSEARPILDFRATDRGAVSLAVLFDTSGSMRGPNFGKGRLVVDRLLGHLNRTTDDEVALFTFDRKTRQETPFSSDAAAVRRALDASDAWGLTSLYDAIGEAAKQVADRPADRRAVIVITDGIDTSSMLKAPDVSGRASAIDVPVYVIAVTPPKHPDVVPVDQDADADLEDLAYWTGGELRYGATPDEAAKAIDAVMTELRQQYLLAIESSAVGGWHRLAVTTKRRNLKVRTREGYFGSAQPPSGRQ